MEVAARLSPPLLSHLRTVVRHEHVLVAARDWSELAEIVRARPIDAVVVDPRAEGKTSIDPVRSLLGRYTSLPVIVYMVLTPETLQAAVELAKYGVSHVVLRGFDDDPRRFLELLKALPANRLIEIALRKLSPRLSEGPPLLHRAVARMFESPQAFQNVGDLAFAAGMTRRNLDRWLDRLGVASARTLILGARVTRAIYYLRDPGYLMGDITRKLGYDSPRLFARQVRAATGLTPSRLREYAEPEKLVEQLTARMCRQGGSDE